MTQHQASFRFVAYTGLVAGAAAFAVRQAEAEVKIAGVMKLDATGGS